MSKKINEDIKYESITEMITLTIGNSRQEKQIEGQNCINTISICMFRT